MQLFLLPSSKRILHSFSQLFLCNIDTGLSHVSGFGQLSWTDMTCTNLSRSSERNCGISLALLVWKEELLRVKPARDLLAHNLSKKQNIVVGSPWRLYTDNLHSIVTNWMNRWYVSPVEFSLTQLWTDQWKSLGNQLSSSIDFCFWQVQKRIFHNQVGQCLWSSVINKVKANSSIVQSLEYRVGFHTEATIRNWSVSLCHPQNLWLGFSY